MHIARSLRIASGDLHGRDALGQDLHRGPHVHQMWAVRVHRIVVAVLQAAGPRGHAQRAKRTITHDALRELRSTAVEAQQKGVAEVDGKKHCHLVAQPRDARGWCISGATKVHGSALHVRHVKMRGVDLV